MKRKVNEELEKKYKQMVTEINKNVNIHINIHKSKGIYIKSYIYTHIYTTPSGKPQISLEICICIFKIHSKITDILDK